MITIRVWIAKLMFANKELRGIRSALAKLISAAIAFFLSIVGIIFVLIGWQKLGLVIILINTGLLSVAMGLPAIKTIRTMAPILRRMK